MAVLESEPSGFRQEVTSCPAVVLGKEGRKESLSALQLSPNNRRHPAESESICCGVFGHLDAGY